MNFIIILAENGPELGTRFGFSSARKYTIGANVTVSNVVDIAWERG